MRAGSCNSYGSMTAKFWSESQHQRREDWLGSPPKMSPPLMLPIADWSRVVTTRFTRFNFEFFMLLKYRLNAYSNWRFSATPFNYVWSTDSVTAGQWRLAVAAVTVWRFKVLIWIAAVFARWLVGIAEDGSSFDGAHSWVVESSYHTLYQVQFWIFHFFEIMVVEPTLSKVFGYPLRNQSLTDSVTAGQWRLAVTAIAVRRLKVLVRIAAIFARRLVGIAEDGTSFDAAHGWVIESGYYSFYQVQFWIFHFFEIMVDTLFKCLLG